MATAVRDAVGSVSEHGTEGDRADSGAADGPNPVEAVVRTVDRFQQRHTGLAFPFAVVKKFGDDGGGVLATSLAYSTFVAVFPLLLLFVTVLGFVLGHDQDAQEAVSRSVLVEFPILGDQIVGSLEPLRGSGLALGVGMVGLAWGGLGVTQTVQHAMAEIWNVPGVRRSSFVARLVRGLALLGLGGCGLVATSVLAASSAFNGDLTAAGVAAATGTIVLNVVLLLGLF